MDKHLAVFILIGIVVFIIFIIYRSNKKKQVDSLDKIEEFTALSGIESELATYDDYGTFNFLFHTDDLPYYDPTYFDMGCAYRLPTNEKPKKCGSLTENENFDRDSFINYQGQKVRRELVPSNYNNDNNYDSANLDNTNQHLLIKKDRTRASAQPPQPVNFYFNNT